MSESHALSFDSLIDVVIEDVTATLRRIENRAVNRARDLVGGAEAHVDELARAGRELGRVRGAAAEETYQREADVEIRDVLDGAFDRLFDRFVLRVRTALEGLSGEPRYPGALAAWAREAAELMDGPADVFAAPADRAPVYDALLEAGASDFQVHADRAIHVGFVVRDLDGRTLLDRRPDALVAEHREALRALLRSRVPEPPAAGRPAED